MAATPTEAAQVDLPPAEGVEVDVVDGAADSADHSEADKADLALAADAALADEPTNAADSPTNAAASMIEVLSTIVTMLHLGRDEAALAAAPPARQDGAAAAAADAAATDPAAAPSPAAAYTAAFDIPTPLPEGEPTPCLIDQWARGAVRVRQRAKVVLDPATTDRGATPSAASDVSSRGSPRRRKKKARPASPGAIDENAIVVVEIGAPKSSLGDPEFALSPQEEVYVRREDVKTLLLRALLLLRLLLPPPLCPSRYPPCSYYYSSYNDLTHPIFSLRYMEQMKQIEAAKRAKLDASARKAVQEAESREKYEKMLKEAKGKNFTVDAAGNLIIIQPPRPESLPQASYAPAAEVHDVRAVDEHKGAGGSPSKRSTRRRRAADEGGVGGDASPHATQAASPVRGEGRSPGGKKHAPPSPFFTVSPCVQPSIIQAMVVQPGIVVFEGETRVEGPVPADDPSHQSKAAFDAKVPRERQETSSPLSLDDGSSYLSNSRLPAGAPASPSRPPPLELHAGDAVDPYAGGRRVPGGGGTSPLSAGGSLRLPDELGGSGQLTAGDIDVDLATAAANNTAASLDSNSVVSGQIGVLPHKQTQKQMGAVISPRAKKPRDRVHARAMDNMSVSSGNRKRLPPPPLGETTGHGIVRQGYGGSSVRDEDSVSFAGGGRSAPGFLPPV